LRFCEAAALVAFQAEEVIAAQRLREAAGAGLLAVHRVGGEEGAGRGRDLPEQGREGGDFVALFGNGYLIEREAQVRRDGGEQLQGFAVVAAAAAEDFAVHGQAGEGGKGAGVEFFEQALEGGVAGRVVVAVVLVALAAQGAELALGEFLAGVFKGAVAAGAPQGGHSGAGQDEALAMAQAVAAACVGQGGAALEQTCLLPLSGAVQGRKAPASRTHSKRCRVTPASLHTAPHRQLREAPRRLRLRLDCGGRRTPCRFRLRQAAVAPLPFRRMNQPLQILAVIGSPRAKSVTRVVVRELAGQLTAAGCVVDVLDLGETVVPPYNPDTSYAAPGIPALKARVVQADAIILGTPDYHGSISSTLKNFLDHFWTEFSGKLIAPVVASHEKGLTVVDQLRTVTRQCYAWALPYAVTCAENHDVKDGQIVSESLVKRVAMLTRDVRVYGELLARQRAADLAGTEPGFLEKLRPPG